MLGFISMIFVLGLSWSSPLAAGAGPDAAWLQGIPLDKAIGTPTYFVEDVMISGAKVREIEKVLGGEKIPFDAGDAE